MTEFSTLQICICGLLIDQIAWLAVVCTRLAHYDIETFVKRS